MPKHQPFAMRHAVLAAPATTGEATYDPQQQIAVTDTGQPWAHDPASAPATASTVTGGGGADGGGYC